jgi:hypothetical protein
LCYATPNGGVTPTEIFEIVTTVGKETDVDLGIHNHNDADMAGAGALTAVDAGVQQVQGTVYGYGERCGNANLLSIAANLKLKKGIDCISDEQLRSLTDTGRFIAEISNMPPPTSQPFLAPAPSPTSAVSTPQRWQRSSIAINISCPKPWAMTNECWSPSFQAEATSSSRWMRWDWTFSYHRLRQENCCKWSKNRKIGNSSTRALGNAAQIPAINPIHATNEPKS